MSRRRPLTSLAPIVRALGGTLYAGGRRALVPGPGHGPGDRSVSLLLADGRVVVHSFAGDDWRDIRDDLRARGLLGPAAAGDPAPGAGHAPCGPEKLAVAATLWDEARPAAGTLAERHVRGRAVRRALPAALRFHPAVPSAAYAGRGRRRPALLAAIRTAAGAFCGVEVAYLDGDGGAADLPVPRKTLGARPAGAAVRLDPPSEVLLVGEGVFSCLSASQALALPAWALLSVGNLVRWSPPAEVRRVVIAADRGRVGEAGAARLATRLSAEGLDVAVAGPPSPYADWNEAAQATGGGGEAGRGGPEPGDRPPAGPGDPS